MLSLAPAYQLVQCGVGAARFRDSITAQYLRPLPGQRVLDVGCGTADILDHLPHDVTYVGCDPNPRYVAAATRRFGRRATFTARVEDVPDLTHSFDLVMAIGVLHHLDDDEVRRLVGMARGALRGGGRFVSVDPALVADQSRVARFLIRHDRGRHVRSPAAVAELVGVALPGVRTTVRHDLLRFPYSHVIAQAEVGVVNLGGQRPISISGTIPAQFDDWHDSRPVRRRPG